MQHIGNKTHLFKRLKHQLFASLYRCFQICSCRVCVSAYAGIVCKMKWWCHAHVWKQPGRFFKHTRQLWKRQGYFNTPQKDALFQYTGIAFHSQYLSGNVGLQGLVTMSGKHLQSLRETSLSNILPCFNEEHPYTHEPAFMAIFVVFVSCCKQQGLVVAYIHKTQIKHLQWTTNIEI